MKVRFTIYADLESLLKKMNACHNNPEKSSTTKSKFDYYRGKDCMKNFSLDLREHATKTINFEKKNDILNKKRRENV